MQRFVYPAPPSLIVAVMTGISSAGVAITGLSELSGTHLRYSKFSNINSLARGFPQVPSRIGMFVLYTPAFLAGAASFWIFPTDHDDRRFLLLRAALTVHFLKRVLEVLFIHKFSGFTGVETMFAVSLSYFVFTATSIYSQYLSRDLPEPRTNLTYPGIVLFTIGIMGNFYHHLILSRLRASEGSIDYIIPRGRLFDLVVCPHYLFEIIDFVGLSLISQTLYVASFTLSTVFYLVARSYMTKKWYLSKFEDFPGHVKSLIPYVF